MLKDVFFNLFIFAIGVKIGPQFFSGLERGGWSIVAIGVIVAVLAPLLSWLCAWLFDLPQGALAGLLAGSNNSSATFGAASSALQSDAVMKWLPGLARIDAPAEALAFESTMRAEHAAPLPGTVAAPLDAHALVREALGPELPDAEARATIPMHTVDVVIGRAEAVGHPLPELLAQLGPGVYPNRCSAPAWRCRSPPRRSRRAT